MKEIVISISETSEGEFQYDIYKSEEDIIEGDESIDGGVCTGTIEEAIGMAYDQAKEILQKYHAASSTEKIIPDA